jgi:hypothetical protein
MTGDITISGTSASGTTIQLDGIGLEPTDTSVNTTVTNRMINRENYIGGDYALDTDSNGRMRIVDGTGAGEINTNGGAIVSVITTDVATALGADAVDGTSMADGTITAAKIAADAITNAKIADDAIAAENLKTGALTADAFAADALVAATFKAASLDGKGDWNTVEPDPVGTAPTAVENREEMDSNSTELAKIGTIPALDGAGQTIGAAIAKLADDNAGADFDATSDSLQAIRDRGDAAWVTGAGSSAPSVVEIREEMDDNSTKLAAIVADTNELQTDNVPGLIAALNDVAATDIVTGGAIATTSGSVDNVSVCVLNNDMLLAAEVNAEMVDVMTIDTLTLPGQAALTNTPTFEEAVTAIYKNLKNRKTQTASQWSLYADDGIIVDQKATVSNIGGVTTVKSEIESGP